MARKDMFPKIIIKEDKEPFRPVSVEGDEVVSSTEPMGIHQRLFKHMYDQHGLILLYTEMDEIVRIVKEEY